METSSPLAAMHRPAAAFGDREMFGSNLALPPGRARDAAALGFRSHFRGNPAFFSTRLVHGSSPAGSLAADLCQNFRIGDEARLVGPKGAQREAVLTSLVLASRLRAVPSSPQTSWPMPPADGVRALPASAALGMLCY